MKRNSTTLFLESPGATTPLPWVDNAPDFTGFNEPTLSVLQSSWQAFIDSGEQLEIVADPDNTPIAPFPDWTAFNTAMNLNPAFDGWYAALKASGSPGERAAIALITPSTMGSAEVFTLAYNTASAIVAPSASDKTAWQAIADQYSIPVTF